MTTLDKLLRKISLRPWRLASDPGSEAKRFLADLREDDLSWTGRAIHEWRSYIPQEMKECWQSLSDEARVVAYIIAEQQAEQEEWD